MIFLEYVIGPGYRARRWLPPDEQLSRNFFSRGSFFSRLYGSAIAKGDAVQGSCPVTSNQVKVSVIPKRPRVSSGHIYSPFLLEHCLPTQYFALLTFIAPDSLAIGWLSSFSSLHAIINIAYITS
jgi:hypothetical protein